MSVRTVYATITDPTGDPRRSLPVFFHAPEGHDAVIARTDDAGMFRAGLVPDVDYRVSVENAVIVDGVTFPAGTVLLVRVDPGEGDVPGVAALVGTINASRPALLDREAALADTLGTLFDRLDTTALSLDFSDLRATLDAMFAGSPLQQGGSTTGGGLADLANTTDEGA